MNKIKCMVLGLCILSFFCCATNNQVINSNITTNSNDQGIVIGTKDRTINLFIPFQTLKSVSQRGDGGQSNPNYFYFVDTNVKDIDVELHISGWLLPIENYKYDHVANFWLEEYGQAQIFNHDIREINNWQAFLFDIPVPKEFKDVNSSHMRANLLQGDTWIDLHLSITDRKPSKLLHDILFEYLKNIQIEG